jgi:hypothetical protein
MKHLVAVTGNSSRRFRGTKCRAFYSQVLSTPKEIQAEEHLIDDTTGTTDPFELGAR